MSVCAAVWNRHFSPIRFFHVTVAGSDTTANKVTIYPSVSHTTPSSQSFFSPVLIPNYRASAALEPKYIGRRSWKKGPENFGRAMALFALESGEFFFQIDLPDFQHGVSMALQNYGRWFEPYFLQGPAQGCFQFFRWHSVDRDGTFHLQNSALSMPFSNFGIGILPAVLSKFMLWVTFQRAYLEQMMTVLLHGRPRHLNPWHFRLTDGNPNFHIWARSALLCAGRFLNFASGFVLFTLEAIAP